MATCVIDKIQSRRCLLAARNKLLNLPQQTKLTASDKVIIKAILNAVDEGQIEECEVTGVLPALTSLSQSDVVVGGFKAEDYYIGSEVVTDKEDYTYKILLCVVLLILILLIFVVL